jgi:hypothetical protein
VNCANKKRTQTKLTIMEAEKEDLEEKEMREQIEKLQV